MMLGQMMQASWWYKNTSGLQSQTSEILKTSEASQLLVLRISMRVSFTNNRVKLQLVSRYIAAHNTNSHSWFLLPRFLDQPGFGYT